MVKQTVNRRTDGTFGRGNQIGRQFQPGKSGNPKGRPTERPLTIALREALDANDGELIKILVQVAIDEALSGNFRYFKEIFDRSDGKVSDKVQHSGQVDSLISQERFEGMDDEQLARLMHAAGIAPGLTPEQLQRLCEMEGGPTE
jgi:hypothetical protein